MALYIIVFLVIILLYVYKKNKIHIDWRSFLRPTLPLATGVFGVYCFTGKQGTGKTYSLTKFVKENPADKKIYSNLTIQGIEYEKITSIKHLLSLKDQGNLYIIFDEIFTLLSDKTIPKEIRDDLMEFLSQQRKMENILLTTAQEWLEIPMTFRRFVRIQIDCSTRPLGKLGGILKEMYYDATAMKWDQLENEYIAPIITTKFSKYQKRYMQSYDTFERIKRLQKDDPIKKDRESVATVPQLTTPVTKIPIAYIE